MATDQAEESKEAPEQAAPRLLKIEEVIDFNDALHKFVGITNTKI